MSFIESFQSIEQHLKAFAESAAQKIEQDLPVIGEVAQQMASNPVFAALSVAVHLNAAPELLQVFANLIAKADAELAAAKAAGAAEAQAPPAQPDVPVSA